MKIQWLLTGINWKAWGILVTGYRVTALYQEKGDGWWQLLHYIKNDLRTVNYTLKMSRMINFMLMYIYHKIKKWVERNNVL